MIRIRLKADAGSRFYCMSGVLQGTLEEPRVTQYVEVTILGTVYSYGQWGARRAPYYVTAEEMRARVSGRGYYWKELSTRPKLVPRTIRIRVFTRQSRYFSDYNHVLAMGLDSHVLHYWEYDAWGHIWYWRSGYRTESSFQNVKDMLNATPWNSTSGRGPNLNRFVEISKPRTAT